MAEERFEQYADIFERLGMDARFQPIPDRLMNVRNEEDLRDARDLINRLISDGTVTAAELARKTTVKASAISALRNDKWKGKRGTELSTASTLCRSLNGILRQKDADAERVDGFVKTKVAEAIYSLAHLVTTMRSMGVIVMPAGAGKTMTLRALLDMYPGSILLTAAVTRTSVRMFLQMWARALGRTEWGQSADVQDRIVNALVRSDRLVMIDECHKLPIQVLDVIREIWDAAQVPILMAATPTFIERLHSRRVGAASRELLDQLSSRVAFVKDFTELCGEDDGTGGYLSSVQDVLKIFNRGKVRLSKDGARYLFQLAHWPAGGGFRRCRMVFDMAVIIFKEKTELTAADLDHVVRYAFGVELATSIHDACEARTPERAASAG